MFFTRQEDYAVLVMKKLAQHYKHKRWLPLREISQEYKLPLPFLKQLMRYLRNAKLINSKEGRQGGYRLRRPPREISIGDIIRAVRGPLAITHCYHELKNVRCSREESCPGKTVLQKVGEQFIKHLDRIKLG